MIYQRQNTWSILDAAPDSDAGSRRVALNNHLRNREYRNLMFNSSNRLYELTDTSSPAETLSEIRNILLLLVPSPDPAPIEEIYGVIIRLFKGEFPGYRASNTKYHNLEHTCSVTLAAARLIHGLHVQGKVFSPRLVQLCLIGALFHDTGLIQTEDETEGTGARHTIGHEERSVALMEKFLGERNFSKEDIRDCRHIIMCTELNLSPAEIPFESEAVGTMGKVLGSADLIAQMADRGYQENLPLLFMEFEEAGIEGFKSPLELFRKTEEFYRSVVRRRLAEELECVSSAALYHFRERWKIDKDLYDASIKYNIRRLKDTVMESMVQLSILSR